MSEIRTSPNIKKTRIVADKRNIRTSIITHVKRNYQKFEEFIFSDSAEKVFIKVAYGVFAIGFMHIIIHVIKVFI